MKVFVESHFGYFPLLWIIHNRGLNNTINRIYERRLRKMELLEKDNSVSIHHRNVQKLAIYIYGVLLGFSPPNFKRYICARLTPIQFSPK